MDYKIKVESISPSWSCCSYKLCVHVAEHDFGKSEYILETLRKWFGEAKYFWGNMYLCSKK